jgi:hypothetical protein
MQNSSMNAQTPVSGANLVYTYKPSIMGAPSQFRLTAEGLEWSVGHKSGLVPYGQIRRVRMSFRPANMQAYRFLTEIWSHDASKLKIVSSSWKSMMYQERLDESYSEFISEMHRRIAQAGTATRFEQGRNRFIFWSSVIVFTAVELGLAGLTVRALQADAIGGAGAIAVFLGVFTWQGGNFLRRNLPGIYRPNTLPAMLMPKK